MANQTIDTSQELLNRLDNEIRELTELSFKTQGVILTLEFISKRLRDSKEVIITH